MANEWMQAYKTICTPCLTYALLIMHFTKEELEHFQAKFMCAALQAYHCHGKFLRAVAFAPISIGSLGLLHLFVLQSIAQVKLFLCTMLIALECSRVLESENCESNLLVIAI